MTRTARTDGGGVVAAGHEDVAAAGARILEKGGNAIDAVVGAMFAAWHAEPILTGPGGGGFLIAHLDGQPAFWDFFSNAPGLGSGPEPYVPPEGAFWGIEANFGSATQIFHIGPGSVAVPGGVAGLCAAQSEAGRLSLHEVLQPALACCERGTRMMAMGQFVTGLLEPIVRSSPDYERYFVRADGSLKRAEDRFHNPELGVFLERLGRVGPADAYTGELGRAFRQAVSGAGGGITEQDLAAYRVERRDPIRWCSADGTVTLLTPPPSSSGMLIAFGLALLDRLPPARPGTLDELLLLRAVFAESLATRAAVIGDATPTRAHAEEMLDGAFIERATARARARLARGPADLPTPPSPDLGSTTHISAIDGAGNAAAVTMSIGEACGLVVPGLGVFPNNFLGEEDLNPLGFHRFAPGVRLTSSMCPVIAQTPERARLALGSGGANRIRTALLQVLRRVCTHGIEPERAVAADRLHYEDGRLYAETMGQLAEPVSAFVEAGGTATTFDAPNMFFGGVHLVRRQPDGRAMAVGDPRRSGAAAVAEAPSGDGRD